MCVDIAPEHGDAKEKTVNRALVPDRRVERMVVGDKPKGKWNTRLAGAVEMARQAGWVGRFGPWEPMWPGFRKEEETYKGLQHAGL